MNFDKHIYAWSPHYNKDVDHFHSLEKFYHAICLPIPHPHLARGNHWPPFWHWRFDLPFLKFLWNGVIKYMVFCLCLFLSPIFMSFSFLLHFSLACSFSCCVLMHCMAIGRCINLPCSWCTFGLIPVIA